MAGNWTMMKILEKEDMNGTLQLKEDEKDADIKAHLFRWWPRRKVRELKRDVENGVQITLFDEDTSQVMETTMKWVGTVRYHIKWDIKNKRCVCRDEMMLMRWDLKYNRLCYKVLVRDVSEIADACSSTS